MTRFLLPAILIALLPASAADAAIYAGYHLDSFAVELGYGTTRKSEQDTDLRFDRLTADGLYYVPVGGFLNLVLTGGVTQDNYGASTFTKKSYTQDGTVKDTRVG